MSTNTANTTDGVTDETGSVTKHLGILLAAIGTLAATTYGVEASDTVAIQCISGRILGRYFVFNGSVELIARYNGMQSAFDGGQEIFRPVGQGVITHRPLTMDDYDRLLTRTDLRHQATTTAVPAVFGQPAVPLANSYLDTQRMFPIWKWSFRTNGYFKTFVCGALALLPMPLITIARLGFGYNIIPELLYALVFYMISAYIGFILDIQREVTYIKVRETNLNPTLGALWVNTFNRATAGAPNSPHTAVDDIVTGQVRRDDNSILVPVIALKPTVEYTIARWYFLLTYFKGPLLSMSYLIVEDSHHRWLVSYGIAAFVQAFLQKAYAKAYLVDARPYEVSWFRRLPGRTYIEEFSLYRKALG